jgi:hypothetical protein
MHRMIVVTMNAMAIVGIICSHRVFELCVVFIVDVIDFFKCSMIFWMFEGMSGIFFQWVSFIID